MESRDFHFRKKLEIQHPSQSSQYQYSCLSPSAFCRDRNLEISDNALCLPSVISSKTERTANHLPLSHEDNFQNDGTFDTWRREAYDLSFCVPNEATGGNVQRPLYGGGAHHPALSSRLGLCHYTTSYLDASRNMDTFANALSLSLSSKPQQTTLKRDREAPGSVLNESDEMSPSVHASQSSGPLGPFTGYETILKSSIFLKPAQELLDELSAKSSTECLRNPRASTPENVVKPINVTKESHQSMIRLDYQRTKSKLQNLHNEVCRMHKQYHHQIQIATSSFEVVAGLENAAPFASLAAKAIFRNFRTMRHAIDSQLKQVAEAVGNDSRIEELRSNIHQQSNLGHSQQVWRPQRGLPEHAVTVLRAWLFEHFLHPYPNDNDKVMLATQTGLSRNQVSNWFINARVRLWKPMVEEMHMIETKGMSESGQSTRVNRHFLQGSSRSKSGRSLTVNKLYESPQLGFGLTNELQHELGLDGSMSFLKPNGNVGVGAVSLTLGLYHQQMQVHHGSCAFK